MTIVTDVQPCQNNLFGQVTRLVFAIINMYQNTKIPIYFQTTCILPPPCFRFPCPWPPHPPRPHPVATTEAPVLPPETLGGFVERMWAYQTIKKLLEKEKYLEDDADKKKQLKDRALKLSLKVSQDNFKTT